MLPVHLHSEYSALDGYSKPDEIAERLVELDLPGAFLTDHGTVAGLMPFATAMKKRGLWTGYGVEAYQAADSRTTRKNAEGKSFKKGEDAHHLILLAKSPEGYRNLLRISDEAHRSGFHYDPRLDLELLKRYREGLICTTACIGSLANQALLKDDAGPINNLYSIFGDDFFVEVHTYDTAEQRSLNKELVSLAHQRGWPLLVATDAHYMRPDDYDAHEALLCAQMGDRLDDIKKHSNVPDDPTLRHPPCLYIMGEEEVRERLSYLPQSAVDEAIANTDLLMEQCSFELEKPGLFLPKVKLEDTTSAEVLIDLVERGIEERYGGDASEEIWERADFELRAIIEAGLQDYFLIVWDYINYALRQGIMVGPGRGSVGGSILAYALGITSIDPIKHDLQFERFWNPGRADGLPDIDVDFEQSARQFMIEYTKRKYGEDCVLPIGNHIFIKPPSAIDKAAMVLGDYRYLTPQIKKIIQTTTDAGILKSWPDMWRELGERAEQTNEPHPLEKFKQQAPDLFALAQDLSGRLGTYGVHASAVVISEVPLRDHLPARMASDDEKRKVLVTQAEMRAVEKAGFPKFDFLGLRNLDSIMMAGVLSGEFGDPDVFAPRLLRLIEERQKGSIERVDRELREVLIKIIDLFRHDTNYDHLPDSFWQQIDNGHTLGFFQVEEGRDARRIGKNLHPRSLDDLAFIVALNRPGPLRDLDDDGRTTVDRFLARRNGEEDVVYVHPFLEDLLEVTYGDFLYQEQVIAYFRKIGYSLSDADHIRKILGKKLVDEMNAEFPTYMKYATQHMEKQSAEIIWNKILEFSKYSFNKAHAVGYGTILAWTMYAKWRWPVEFVMASITTNQKRVPAYIGEARRIGVKVLPPDINRSQTVISKADDAILYGLRDIKNVGDEVSDWIVANRPYASPEEFYERCVTMKPVVVRSNVRDALMDAGAFDSFGYRLVKCERCAGKGRVRLDPNKRLLDDCPDCEKLGYVQAPIPSEKTRANLEMKLLGIALTNQYEDIIERNREEIEALDELSDADVDKEGLTVVVPGVVKEIQELQASWYVPPEIPPTWARVTIEWEGEEVTFAAFPEMYHGKQDRLRRGVLGEFTLETSKRGPRLKKVVRYV